MPLSVHSLPFSRAAGPAGGPVRLRGQQATRMREDGQAGPLRSALAPARRGVLGPRIRATRSSNRLAEAPEGPRRWGRGWPAA